MKVGRSSALVPLMLLVAMVLHIPNVSAAPQAGPEEQAPQPLLPESAKKGDEDENLEQTVTEELLKAAKALSKSADKLSKAADSLDKEPKPVARKRPRKAGWRD